MRDMLNELYAYLDEKQEEMAAALKELVNLESYSYEVEGVNRVIHWLKALFEAEGMRCHIVDVGANGPTLLGVLGEDRPGKPVLFSGHADTVIRSGVYEPPVFRREGSLAYGPGVLDMKGGIVIALFVVKALNHIGYAERPLKIAFSGDEEIGHFGSSGAETLTEVARCCACAFNLETGLLNNTLCCGRKGRLLASITVHGVESHAGNDFLRGRNAILEMAHKIVAISALTDLEKGTTVTCSTIRGGTVNNAVPKECAMEVECRFTTLSEMEGYRRKLEQICAQPEIEGTNTEIVYSSAFAPYEATQEVMDFLSFIGKVARDCGLEEVQAKQLGGSSDAAYVQMAGIPVICSCGIQGEWNHTTREYARLDSMSPRAKLLSSVILRLNDYTE